MRRVVKLQFVNLYFFHEHCYDSYRCQDQCWSKQYDLYDDLPNHLCLTPFNNTCSCKFIFPTSPPTNVCLIHVILAIHLEYWTTRYCMHLIQNLFMLSLQYYIIHCVISSCFSFLVFCHHSCHYFCLSYTWTNNI